MVMLAAWGAVLSRYNGSEDLVIGTPVSGRTLAETREMIGMFVNMLPIRLKPRSGTSFDDYLTDTRTTMLDALSAQDVPFDRIVEKLGQQRTAGRHPLFDVSFDYHNMEHHQLRIGGLKGQQIDTDPLAVGMDLVITATETADGIQFLLDYSSDLFDATTIEGLVHHFGAFLERVCADSTAPVGAISIYTETEHDAWLSRLTGAPFTAIHDLVARQVVEHPQATAVIDGTGRSYSFAQLDAHANAVATRLLEAGMRTGDRSLDQRPPVRRPAAPLSCFPELAPQRPTTIVLTSRNNPQPAPRGSRRPSNEASRRPSSSLIPVHASPCRGRRRAT